MEAARAIKKEEGNAGEKKKLEEVEKGGSQPMLGTHYGHTCGDDTIEVISDGGQNLVALRVFLPTILTPSQLELGQPITKFKEILVGSWQKNKGLCLEGKVVFFWGAEPL